jgi:hypothetical protein
MRASPSRRPRLSLSMRQMMKLVVFAAAASACVAPFVQLTEVGAASWPVVIIWSIVAVPLTLAVVAIPLVRKRPLKDWSIRALLIVSTGSALGIAAFFVIQILRDSFRFRRLLAFGAAAESSLVVVVLGFALFLLLKKAVPGRCPDCRRRSLLPTGLVRRQHSRARKQVYQCLRCEGLFWNADDSWETVTTDARPAGPSAGKSAESAPAPAVSLPEPR